MTADVALLLRVEDAIGETWTALAGAPPTCARSTVDVCVSVEPDHTVADLTAALAGHIGSGSGSAEMARLRRPEPSSGAATRPSPPMGLLDPSTRIGELALRSGERLVLTTGGCSRSIGDGEAIAAQPGSGPTLVVASGPDVGRRCAIGTGIMVGRDRSCHLVLDDPNAARRALWVEPSPVRHRPATPTSDPDPHGTEPLTIARSVDGSPVSINGAAISATGDDGATDDDATTGDRPGVGVTVDDLIRIGSTSLRVVASDEPSTEQSPSPSSALGEAGDRSGEIVVHRVPDRSNPPQLVVFPPLGDVPERPEPPRFGLLLALAPVLLGVTLAVLYSPRMLVFAAFSPVMAGAAWLEAKRRNRARFATAMAAFDGRLAERVAQVGAALHAERQRRFELAPDIAALGFRADAQPPRIWCRSVGSDHGLVVRLGLGAVRSMVEIQPETRGDREAQDRVARALDGHRFLDEVPVTVDLASAGVIALVGEPSDTGELAASIVVQASCHHPPSELVVAASLDPANPLLRWIGWLPHARAASSPLSGLNIAAGPARGELLRELTSVADRRVTSDRTATASAPRLLLVIDGTAVPDEQLAGGLLNAAAGAGISVLWLVDRPDCVPWQTTVTVNCRPILHREMSLMTSAEEPDVEQRLEIDRVPTATADRLARMLAPCRDPADVAGSGQLPAVATLAETLGVERFGEDWVSARWRRADPSSLDVTLGVAADGPFVIDLVAHGPHGLIGGTSGAGKSELLISLVASLLATHPPNKVNVLFVDYKGGASSEPFTDSPHTVGCVTNLDPFLARRALMSLRAELNRRMALLAGRAKDLAELAARVPRAAPPALVIVVDELAALVQDVPEFVAGLVDIAQRGRSLGIHLLLATQRPAGVVNDQILANTNLRIALRMLDGSESSSLVGSREAAAIPTEIRGRALARLGPLSPVEFQSAWSAAPVLAAGAGKAIEVRPLLQRHHPEPVSAAAAADGSHTTQLDELLEVVSSAAASNHAMFTPRRPWCDELPAVVPLADVVADRRGAGVDDTHGDDDSHEIAARGGTSASVVIGVVDDPNRQHQGPAVVDLSTGALGLFGVGGAGATTALRTVAVSAALGHGCRASADLAIFGLDFGSGDLADVVQLPPCVEVAPGDDLEAVTRVVHLLDSTVHERRSQRRRSDCRMSNPDGSDPTVLLLIDDYGSLAATFEGGGAAVTLYPWFEKLNRVISDGRQLGVHTALTATRRAAVKAGVMSSITNRIVLRQAEPSGFAEHGLPGSLHDAELVPGRGFLGATTQVQIAVADPAEFSTASCITGRARRSPLATDALSADIRLDSLTPVLGSRPTRLHSVVVGVADLAPPGEAFTLDLIRSDLAIFGGPGSGRSTALCAIAHQLVTVGAEIWAIGGTGSPLERLPGLHRREFGASGEVSTAIDDLLESVASPTGTEQRPMLVIDDLDLLDRPELDRSLGQLATAGLRWLAATTTGTTFSANPFVQQLRRARSMLYLQPDSGRDVHELTGAPATFRPGLAMPPGRGALIVDRRATVVQVARI